MESQSKDASLPRFTSVPAFDPHRKSFECKREADVNPPVNARAQELFEQVQALDDWRQFDQKTDWAAMAKLYEQAMQLGHWKAQYNLATMYMEGLGVARSGEKALLLTEDLMKQGVPAAWDLMGTLYMSGAGPLKQDSTVGYAFWQYAADLGSMRAQSFLGKKLSANHDEPPTFWGNWPIGEKMLECSYSQGYGQAAFDLGVILNALAVDGVDVSDKGARYQRALRTLHDGVKFGHQGCAGYLFGAFDDGDALVGNAKDPARARRYKAISDRLRRDHYLKLPNLDKVLPLPPAHLPKWDSDPETLINAAKGVRVTPKPQQHSANRYPQGHRAYMPPGASLQVPAQFARIPMLPGFTSVLAEGARSTGLARAPIAGYWQAKSIPAGPNESHYVSNLRTELADLPPLRFDEGERMQLTMGNSNLPHEDMTHYLVEWHFAGRPVPMHQPQDSLAKAGTVRTIEAATSTVCKGDKLCPKTGIWQPHVLDTDHPLSKVLSYAQLGDGWKWQAFVQEGQAMPSLKALGMPVEDTQVDWRLMQTTPLGFDV